MRRSFPPHEVDASILKGLNRPLDAFPIGGPLLAELTQAKGSPESCIALTAQGRPWAQAVLHGVGIGALHLGIAARHPSLVRVLPRLPIPKVETWLVMHEDLRGNAGVRAVFDALFRFLQRSFV